MFTAKQEHALKNCNARINILDGSVRSGKTHISYFMWLHRVKYGAPGLKAMVGKTLDTLKTNVLEPMQELFGDDVISWSDKGKLINIGGRTLKGYGANDERSETKIRGATFAAAYGDEVSLYSESFFRMLLSRLSEQGASFIGTTNPDTPYHYLNTDFLSKEGLNLRRFHFHIDDNTFLDPAYVADLKKEYTGLWYKRFIDGLWVMAEGSIYDMFDTDIHVVDGKDELPYDNYVVGCDYGTFNPCVFVLLGYNSPEDIHVIKEYYYDSQRSNRQKTDAEYVEDLKEFIRGIDYRYIIIDPSASSFLAACAKEGIRVRKANNTVLDGIKLVSKKLHRKHLTISQKCVNGVKEMQSYVWDERSQKLGEDKPLKQNDHFTDALRYVVFTEFNEGNRIYVA